MFKCFACDSAAPGDKSHKVVIEAREVEYNLQIKYVSDNVFEEPATKYKTVRTSKGTEIATEVNFCKRCLPPIVEPSIINTITRYQVIGTKQARHYTKDTKGEGNGKKKERDRKKERRQRA